MVALNTLLLGIGLGSSAALASGVAGIVEAQSYIRYSNLGIRSVDMGRKNPTAEQFATFIDKQTEEFQKTIASGEEFGKATPKCNDYVVEYNRYSDTLDKYAPNFVRVACDKRFAKAEDRTKVVDAHRGLRNKLEEFTQQSIGFCPDSTTLSSRTTSNAARLDEIILAYEPLQLNCIL